MSATIAAVNIHSPTFLEVGDAAKARTACTGMYKSGILKDSNTISAVYSLFPGAFSGVSVKRK
jgi:hypothetical protein